jgi:hypothetical protein
LTYIIKFETLDTRSPLQGKNRWDMRGAMGGIMCQYGKAEEFSSLEAAAQRALDLTISNAAWSGSDRTRGQEHYEVRRANLPGQARGLGLPLSKEENEALRRINATLAASLPPGSPVRLNTQNVRAPIKSAMHRL